jgi:hypothetical protein
MFERLSIKLLSVNGRGFIGHVIIQVPDGIMRIALIK